MAKLRVTFEVDNVKLFDTLAAMVGGRKLLAERVISVLLSGQASLAEAIALQTYGITAIEISAAAQDPTESSSHEQKRDEGRTPEDPI